MIRVLNMTNLFKKELLIYSFFDIKLKRPARIVWFAYFFLLMVLFGAPFLFIFPINVWTLMIAVGLPFAGASFMSKPIWGGKSFVQWFKTQVKFISSKKYYYDGKAGDKLKTYYVDSQIAVSRKRDFMKLTELERKESGQYE